MTATGPERKPSPRLRLVRSPTADPAEDPSDEVLLERLRDGRRDAADGIYDRYAKDAERMLVRTCGQGPEIADLLHDVFVRAFERAHSVRKPSALRSWIVSIAVRRAREHLRDAEKRRPRLQRAPPAPAASRDPESSLTVRRVFALLDRLAPDDRIAFTLRRIEGMKLEEVAGACGVSLATAKRRIRRGEARFRELAADDELLAAWTERG